MTGTEPLVGPVGQPEAVANQAFSGVGRGFGTAVDSNSVKNTGQGRGRAGIFIGAATF